ncbi:hypothetical protein [uncultured Arcobacter sp.]|uniref:hypothetical protein n=1 Tax=uncultured Arcobacter sp. TaxID=165434 RepID=UPI00263701AD|nr:hypothetical protein [uncultured Arcobacter sp.]
MNIKEQIKEVLKICNWTEDRFGNFKKEKDGYMYRYKFNKISYRKERYNKDLKRWFNLNREPSYYKNKVCYTFVDMDGKTYGKIVSHTATEKLEKVLQNEVINGNLKMWKRGII